MPLPALRRRALLLGSAAAAFGPSSWADTASNTLASWRPAKAPGLKAVDLASEKPVTLADFAGQPLIINFWATWCGPCRNELPALNAAVDRFASRGLRLVAVNHGEMPERARRFLAEVPINGTVVLDRSQTQLRAWGAEGLPASFVLDAAGHPRYRAFGEIDWLAPSVLDALASVTSSQK